MIGTIFGRLADNFKHSPITTSLILLGFFVFSWVLNAAVNTVLSINFSTSLGVSGMLIALPIVVVLSRCVPFLKWFWSAPQIASSAKANAAEAHQERMGSDEVEKGDGDAGTDPLAVRSGTRPIRQTPRHTEISEFSDHKTVVTVKVAVRFWCWALPSVLLGLAVVFALFGGAKAYVALIDKPFIIENGKTLAATSQMALNSALGTAVSYGGLFLVMSIASYFLTRPNIRISIDDEVVIVGFYRFDRAKFGGFRSGYSIDKNHNFINSFRPATGMSVLSLSYGPWGEDTIYLMDSYNTDQIVVWLNDLIAHMERSSIITNYDPQAGQKIELL